MIYMWRLIEDRVQKCSAIKNDIVVVGGSSQETPLYLIR